jgi:hypothetical protein
VPIEAHGDRFDAAGSDMGTESCAEELPVADVGGRQDDATAGLESAVEAFEGVVEVDRLLDPAADLQRRIAAAFEA